MEISNVAVHVTKVADVLPGISFISNLTELFFEHVYVKHLDDETINQNHYYTLIHKEKSDYKRLALMIPVVNIIVTLYYYFTNKASEEDKPNQMSQNSPSVSSPSSNRSQNEEKNTEKKTSASSKRSKRDDQQRISIEPASTHNNSPASTPSAPSSNRSQNEEKRNEPKTPASSNRSKRDDQQRFSIEPTSTQRTKRTGTTSSNRADKQINPAKEESESIEPIQSESTNVEKREIFDPDNKDVVLRYAIEDPDSFAQASPELKRDLSFITQLLEQTSKCQTKPMAKILEHIDDSLKDKQFHHIISLLLDKRVVTLNDIKQYLPQLYQAADFWEFLLKRAPYQIKHLPDDLRTKENLKSFIVYKDVYKYLTKEEKNDPQNAFAAAIKGYKIKQMPRAVQKKTINLLVRHFLLTDKPSWKRASSTLSNNEDLVYQLIVQSKYSKKFFLEHAGNKLQNDLDFLSKICVEVPKFQSQLTKLSDEQKKILERLIEIRREYSLETQDDAVWCVQDNPMLLEKLPDRWRNDLLVMEEAYATRAKSVETQDDAIRCVQDNPMLLEKLPNTWRNDPLVMEEAYKQRAESVRSKKDAINFVKTNGMKLRFLSEKFKKQQRVVSTACVNNPEAIQFAHPNLLENCAFLRVHILEKIGIENFEKFVVKHLPEETLQKLAEKGIYPKKEK